MRATNAQVGFTQENDCCDSGSIGQDIVVTVDDGGGGPFVIIQTDRWAVGGPDDIDAFANQLKSILGMVEAEEGSE